LLPYLDACMKEVLHVHPTAAFNLDRVLLMGGRTINRQFVPAGTIVSMVGWVIQNTFNWRIGKWSGSPRTICVLTPWISGSG
jgi:hypothetical protein